MVKRLIKLSISIVVYALTEIKDRIYLFLGKKLPARRVVLYYHAVPEEELQKFLQQMDLLIRFTEPFSIANGNCQFTAGKRYSAVTFDDGLSETVNRVLPELMRRNIPITIFVPSACLGEHPPWIIDPMDPSLKEKVLSADELREVMGKNELVTIGSHGMTHRNLLSLDDVEGKREIFQSKVDLERLLAKRIDLISFPHGDYRERHLKWALEAGYKKAFGTFPAYFIDGGNIGGRVRVDPSDWLLEFKMKLLGAYRWLPWAIAVKRKLRVLKSFSCLRQEATRAEVNESGSRNPRQSEK